METIHKLTIFFISCFFLFCLNGNAQVIDPKETAKEKGTSRANSKLDEGIDAGFNKIEEGIGSLFKKKKKSDVKENEKAKNGGKEENVSDENQPETAPEAASVPRKPQLVSTTQYDFVPGDQVLYFEDFSQDAIGDFPALWTSNSGGEVKTVNIAPGNWFHMNGDDAVYCYTKSFAFPENFIVEFDIIPDAEFDWGIQFTLYHDKPDDPKELNDELYPGTEGLHFRIDDSMWETLGYKDDLEHLNGNSEKNTVVKEEANHVIIWIQKRRVRIYHQGAKALDVPTGIQAGTVFDRFRFSGWNSNSSPFVTNLKITTASPDTRSKLITEGKLVTYGITFDVNKADIKPESYGTLKSIADVLNENSGVKVKIVGHTDADGDDASNLDLSKRRAESVKNELAKTFGIEASRLETEGAGETRPVASNDTPENKAKNRRVELIKL